MTSERRASNAVSVWSCLGCFGDRCPFDSSVDSCRAKGFLDDRQVGVVAMAVTVLVCVVRSVLGCVLDNLPTSLSCLASPRAPRKKATMDAQQIRKPSVLTTQKMHSNSRIESYRNGATEQEKVKRPV